MKLEMLIYLRRTYIVTKMQRSGDETSKRSKLIDDGEPIEKANFSLSGALAKDKKTGNVMKSTSNRANVLVSKYSEPVDAMAPDGNWRVIVFEGDVVKQELYLHRKSYFIIGREEEMADIVIPHPSVSKEHVALQYRKNSKGVTKLYMIDLESTNGTKLNHDRVSPARYVEILHEDVLMFGECPNEYVFMRTGDVKKKA